MSKKGNDMKLYAVFEVINSKATQVSPAFPEPLAREFYGKLNSARDNRYGRFAESKLEIREAD